VDELFQGLEPEDTVSFNQFLQLLARLSDPHSF
jgi:hypothetical protein